MVSLIPLITGTPGQPPSYNVGMAETFSWIPVENNADRPLFARAGYITNLSDLTISLSTSNLNIGAVEIKDSDSELRADVVALNGGRSGLCVSGEVTLLNPVTSVNTYKTVTNWDVLSANLASNGFSANTYTTLPSNAASVISISNITNSIMWIKNASKTIPYPLPVNASIDIDLVSNTNEVKIATEANESKTVYGIFTKFN